MRIISGYLKGKKIKLPKDKKTRPLKDLVKESIFNILVHSNKINCKIENAHILDLFSGSGSFGLECISRGAKKVFFNENYSEALKILNENITLLKCKDKVKILDIDCFNLKNVIEKSSYNFDIIFMDPPFKEKKINTLIETLLDLKLLKENGLIILHRKNKEKENLTEKFNIIETRIYGVSKIIFGN